MSARICYHPVRIRAVAQGDPVRFESGLPDYVRRIIGVCVTHGIGMESTFLTTPPKPADRIGWLNLEANNRRNPIGQFDMFYDVFYSGTDMDDAIHEYQDVRVDVEKDTLVTGVYYQEASAPALATGVSPVEGRYIASGVLFTVYLKCERDD